MRAEDAFVDVDLQSSIYQALENHFDLFLMVLQGSVTEYEDIIDVGAAKVV